MRTLKLQTAKDGVRAIERIDENMYRNADGLNKSLLVKFMKSPKHYLAALNEKHETTDSMRMGTALHASLFRESPEEHFVVRKKVDGRTTEGKAYNARFDASIGGRAVITEEQNETVKGMVNSLMENYRFSKMYERTTHKEMGIFSHHELFDGYKFQTKGMLDGYIESEGIIYDVKSTQDSDIESFKWDFKRYQYDIQQIHYTQLLKDTGLPFSEFVFVTVENKPPFAVAFFSISKDLAVRSFVKYKSQMDFFGACHKKQDFNIGYTSGTQEINY